MRRPSRASATREYTSAGLALVAFLAVVLTACGGNGGSAASPAAQVAGPTPVATIAGIAAATMSTGQGQASAGKPTADETDPPLAEIDPATLQAEVDALVANIGGVTAVEVEEPDGTPLASENAGEQIEAASLYKLAVMVEVFLQRDMGVLTFDDEIVLEPYHFTEGGDVFSEEEIGTTATVGTLVEAMITASSNVAASALLEYVGTDAVNETMASLGLSSTQIRWYPGPTETPEGRVSGRGLLRISPDIRADDALNVTSAADIAALFRMLLAGEVVNAEASQEMLDLLALQQINDRLPAYLPGGTVVAHKTGNLDGLMHDAGIIFAPTGPVIVVVMTEDLDELTSTDLIARIGLLAYEAHQ